MKKIIAIILALIMSFSCFSLVSFAETVSGNTTKFAGGNGTEENPYLISTKEHLDNVRFYLSSHFKMINDIEFTDADFSENGAYYNNGLGWEPLGYSPDYFSGTFDGNNHKIYNLYINRTSSSIGLFGIAEANSIIKNLRLVDAKITGNKNVGSIVGSTIGADITNCYSSTDIYGEEFVGGIAGHITNTSIINCYSSSNVNGTTYIGGIAGGIYETSVISHCSTTGVVSGASKIGGIGGYVNPYVNTNVDLSAIIQYCCNSAKISGENSVGGIIGYVYTTYAEKLERVEGTYGGASYIRVVWFSPKEVVINDCYNVGDITATAGSAGGIIGESVKCSGPYSDTSKNTHKSTLKNSYNCGNVEATSTAYATASNSSAVSVSDCFYLENCVDTNNGGGTSLTHNQMRAQSVFSKWDFDNVWTMYGREDYLYPELRDVELVFPEDFNHKHEYISEVTKEATHLEEGETTYTCACGDSYTEAIAKLKAHTYEEVVTAPTCTAKGYTTYICACGESYVDNYTDKLEHEYTSVITAPATHLTEGVKTFTCKCGDSYTEAIAKLEGHTYTSEVTKEPTHLEEGEMTFTCECGDSYTEVIEKIAKHNYKEDVTEPTCTKKGYTTYTCECGDSYIDDYTEAKGHIYSVTTTQPTCIQNGLVTTFCTSCGDTHTETLEPTGHSFAEGSSKCENCDFDKADDCSCNCHKGGISGLIFKIILFFQRIFKTNKTCACGIAHY